MPQILPQRWWLALFLAAIGAVVAGAIEQGEPGFLGAIAIGALVGFLASMLFVPLFVLHDHRLITLRKRNPAAVVVQAFKDDQTITALNRIANRGFEVEVGRAFTIVFDSAGLSMWRGFRNIEQVVDIPWSEVATLALDEYFESKGSNQRGYFRVRLEIIREGEPSTIRFGVEREAKVPFTGAFLTEAEIVDTLEAIEKLRGGKAAPQRIAARSYVSAGLVEGRSAWAAHKLLGTTTGRVGFVGQVFVVLGFVSWRFEWPPIVTIAGLAVGAVLFVASLLAWFAETKATARESAAGYTTLNGVNLSVEQRHPRTGVVIRPAGASALSKKEFAELLAQS